MTGTKSGKEIAKGLSRVQAISQQLVRKIEQDQGRISGFTPELAKIRTHLETYRDLSRTKRMTAKLRSTRDLGNRSKRTRGYIDLAVDTFNRLSQDTNRAEDVLWGFGWLDRLLKIESQNSRGSTQRRDYQPAGGRGRQR